MTTISDVVIALDKLSGGRVSDSNSEHSFAIWKDSGISGKRVQESPGLVWGDPDRKVKKLAVAMTLSEHDIELAAATGVDAIVAHHPIADAASSGGVTLKNYLSLSGLAVLELHEAFHGLHPGIAFLHGHQVRYADIHYGGVEGNVLFVGTVLPEIRVLGDILQRLDSYMGLEQEKELLKMEREIRGSSSAIEATLVTQGRIVLGSRESPVKHVLHIFPHTGFSPSHLRQAKEQFPEIDTVLASISRVRSDSELVREAERLGLRFVIGNCHVLEILENGLPLAYALEKLLPEVEVVVFRERVTSIPLREMGGERIREYAEKMADHYLVKKVNV
ncbi:Nif3-like dinuclear metal center hexameric protein [Brevibacillus choshinensis]|uniref:GTP cyclohydrolase 1 type 2 homolog n=1 Tax=Brevibacillus choshinensis TaxID=54911 RepID=A0ABX7FKK7_BRECH|nr:Nif3-like dinuclear metal center hexameric protein [Brevibacillus choshinensis]QRG66249.1 Nif3-like dinuclear metal center hexameric protein [Brevibacillus choshinensis]